VLLAATVVARADDAKPKDPPKDESPKTAAEQYQALLKEFSDARNEVMKAVRAAKPEEQQKVYDEKVAQLQKYASKFLELAKKHSDDPTGFDALAWVCMNFPGTPEGKQATEMVLKDHIKSEKLGPLTVRLGSGPDGEGTLRRIIAESPHKDVKGLATFRLGQALKSSKKDEAEKFFEEVFTKFPDVKLYGGTIGKMAKGELNEVHGKLELSKPAMDIEAEDIDGTKFKLSDYRGKVVMLDFWGHW
jgi:hypothetical protein